jgi:excisionase family DNA binding protein
MEHLDAVSPIAFSPRSAAKAANVGVNKIYDWLNSGALEAKKDGGRTIITSEALKRHIEALPSYLPSSEII